MNVVYVLRKIPVKAQVKIKNAVIYTRIVPVCVMELQQKMNAEIVMMAL